MELDRWVAVVLLVMVVVGAIFALVKLILLTRRHERESREWARREWEERQRPLPWERKNKIVEKRTKRKEGSDGQ